MYSRPHPRKPNQLQQNSSYHLQQPQQPGQETVKVAPAHPEETERSQVHPQTSGKVFLAAVQPLLPETTQPLHGRGDGFHRTAQVLWIGYGERGPSLGHRHADSEQHGPFRIVESVDAAVELSFFLYNFSVPVMVEKWVDVNSQKRCK